jgi:hypothetical protein
VLRVPDGKRVELSLQPGVMLERGCLSGEAQATGILSE